MEGICKLCLENKTLKKSHIINEYWYNFIYDDLHRIEFEIDFSLASVKKSYEQLGYREYLLCKDCEIRFSRYEGYISRIYSSKLIQLPNKTNYLNGIDYKLFKLFQLSILWRCSVTILDFFKIDIGTHSEIIRKMLLIDDPGDEQDYPCNLNAIFFDQEIANYLILGDEPYWFENLLTCRIIFGGFIWHFFISKDENPYPINNRGIKKNGTIIINKYQAYEIEFLKEKMAKLYDNGKLK